MCVRALTERLAIEQWRAKHGAKGAADAVRREMYPGEYGTIALPRQGELTLETARWGLVPSWAKEASFGRKNAYNARAETLLEKPTFRGPFRRARCLLPVSAFYERAEGRWLRMSPKSGEAVAIAALYEEPNDLSPELTFTMVTTSPNETIAKVHDRMPVVLEPGDYEAWLDTRVKAEDVRGLLVPCPPDLFEIEDAGPVGKAKDAEPTLF